MQAFPVYQEDENEQNCRDVKSAGFFVNCNNLKELPDIWAKSYIQRHAAPSVEWADYRISIPAGICSK